ncbi:hypothetical protein BLNAU_11970 [Blattamonas nauphoetae]|uniref:Uncharacterized protein n=1 Tax=Blattamonas nauphoetae TaxID=2049346 RepID=A0ABQ9XLQ9_9EUKA|nr:hypothetical protein BLNAU_11970 [Blattamonas nauphoetae]
MGKHLIQSIAIAVVKMLGTLIVYCSTKIILVLVNADLIPQIINTLDPQSLSFAEAVDFHINLMIIITRSLWLSTPRGLTSLRTKDENERQSVHETVLMRILTPSEKYICHLCLNRFSLIDGDQSWDLRDLLTQLLEISPYHQPTMDFVVHMPVILTIPSSLTFFEMEETIFCFLLNMNLIQREWNTQSGEVQQMWKTVHRTLRMEGIEEMMETKLQNDRNEVGGWIVRESIRWNNKQGMNLPKQK